MYKLDEESREGSGRMASITSGLAQQQAGGPLNIRGPAWLNEHYDRYPLTRSQ